MMSTIPVSKWVLTYTLFFVAMVLLSAGLGSAVATSDGDL